MDKTEQAKGITYISWHILSFYLITMHLLSLIHKKWEIICIGKIIINLIKSGKCKGKFLLITITRLGPYG